MSDDERVIRDLVEQWAAAAQSGDLEAVVARHDPACFDLVSLDVSCATPVRT